jgi:hypothetical protein
VDQILSELSLYNTGGLRDKFREQYNSHLLTKLKGSQTPIADVLDILSEL